MSINIGKTQMTSINITINLLKLYFNKLLLLITKRLEMQIQRHAETIGIEDILRKVRISSHGNMKNIF